MRASSFLVAAVLVAAPLQTPLGAQGTPLDRSLQPKPGKAPTLRVPTWSRTKLTNGAELIVTEKHELPLVSVRVSFIGGSANFEPADKLGVAGLTAQLLSDGTVSRTGDQLSDAQQLLGTSINAGIGTESGNIGFTALKGKLDPALALLADMLLHPRFADDALERLRGRALVGLAQSKDQPNAVAANVFAKTLYGDEHPYGRVVTEKTMRAITRDDIVAFHRAYFRPGRAVITVTGDIPAAKARAAVEAALKDWSAGGDRPSFSYPALPPAHARTIYLVDKPKAAQSVFALGIPGPARDTRYPRVSLAEVIAAQPELILLPDEPFAFDESAYNQILALLAETPAVKAQRVRRIDIDGTPYRYNHQSVWAGVATLTGLPATAMPLERTDQGLPVGAQIIGPYLEDRTTIAFAGLCEREFGGFVAPPRYAG